MSSYFFKFTISFQTVLGEIIQEVLNFNNYKADEIDKYIKRTVIERRIKCGVLCVRACMQHERCILFSKLRSTCIFLSGHIFATYCIVGIYAKQTKIRYCMRILYSLMR